MVGPSQVAALGVLARGGHGERVSSLAERSFIVARHTPVDGRDPPYVRANVESSLLPPLLCTIVTTLARRVAIKLAVRLRTYSQGDNFITLLSKINIRIIGKSENYSIKPKSDANLNFFFFFGTDIFGALGIDVKAFLFLV